MRKIFYLWGWSHAFVEIYPEIFNNFYGQSSPSTDCDIVVSYKRKYVYEVLVNRLVKLARKKCG